MKTRNKGLRTIRVADIIDNPDNFRSHPESQKKAFAATVDTIGFYGYPDVYETPGGLRLIDGELRKYHLLERHGDDATIEVNVTDFDDREAKIALATKDPLAALADNDELASLELIDDDELKRLFADVQDIDLGFDDEPEEVEPQIDRAEELREQWRTEKGQLWTIQGKQEHRLLCGDATTTDVDNLLSDETIPMVWTDPPYGHKNQDGDLQSSRVGIKGARKRKAVAIENDDEESSRKVIHAALTAIHDRLEEPACCCCCCCCGGGGPRPTFAWFANRLDSDGLSFFHAVIWDKSDRGHGLGWRYRRNYEFVLVAHKSGGKLLWREDAPATPNIKRICPPGNELHPTTKPTQLVASFIDSHTTEHQLIYDPFLGSGTTMLAAEQLNRRCYGMEISPAYCAVILQRMTDAGCSCKLEE